MLETIAGEDLIGERGRAGRAAAAGLRGITRGDARIGDVRGRGMMIGVELGGGGEFANNLMAACADAGLLVLTCGVDHDVIRWLPPVDVTSDEIDEGLGIFEQVLRAA